LNDQDISASATGEPVRFPSAEELRMVRAIALLALQEAARHGEYRATFHGFRVQALRKCLTPGAEAFVEVNLCVSLGKTVVERGLIATTDAGAMEPKP
jgi:hypothetical protein